MAELSELESKLGEVMGLAQAAQVATQKVEKLVEDDELKQTLRPMNDEAAQAEERCQALADGLEGKKTAIADQARETKQEAQEMMKTYLSGDDVDGLDGFEFLIMAEAGELGHVEIVETMNESVRMAGVDQLVSFVKPIQERHVRLTRDAALKLAKEEVG